MRQLDRSKELKCFAESNFVKIKNVITVMDQRKIMNFLVIKKLRNLCNILQIFCTRDKLKRNGGTD